MFTLLPTMPAVSSKSEFRSPVMSGVMPPPSPSVTVRTSSVRASVYFTPSMVFVPPATVRVLSSVPSVSTTVMVWSDANEEAFAARL